MRKAGCAPHCSNAAGQQRASERRLSFRKWVLGGAHWGGGCSALAPLLCSGLLLGGGRCPVPPPPRIACSPPVPLSDPELDALPPGPPLHFPHSQLLQVTVCFAGWAENQSGEGRDEACCQPRMSPVTARSGTAVASAEAQSVVLPEVALSCRDTTLPLLSSTCPRSPISQHRPGGATFHSFLSALSTASLLRSCGHKQSSRQSAVKAPRYSARGQSAPVLTTSLSSPLLKWFVGFL